MYTLKRVLHGAVLVGLACVMPFLALLIVTVWLLIGLYNDD